MTAARSRLECAFLAVTPSAQARRQLRRLADLAGEVAEIIRGLSDLEGRVESPGDYSTGDGLPQGVSKRTFNATCRSGRVSGAVKDGREWSCSVEAWHAARARAPRSLNGGGIEEAAVQCTTAAIEELAHIAVCNARSLRQTRGNR